MEPSSVKSTPEPMYRATTPITELGSRFYDEVAPADFPALTLRFRNDRCAATVGLDGLSTDQWLDHFGRFAPLPDNLANPLALRYHGHQFRNYNPELGDGRGFLFAQLLDANDNRILDLGTKGSGRTPWSRGGDGRLTLKGGVREVLATELLEALGVYTSKTLSLIETGEELMRNDEPSPTRSSVMFRLSHSHIRFGSFQRQAYLRDADAISTLIGYAIRHYAPELEQLPPEERTAAWLRDVCQKTARLGAQWHFAGFVHGVLNTDNMNVTGESFDYGPYRFLPKFDPDFTAAYFDTGGLYAFGRQPETLMWNLTRLAETLIPLCDVEHLQEALGTFEPEFHAALIRQCEKRLNLKKRASQTSDSGEMNLVETVFAFLLESECGFERFFFDWFGGLASEDRASASPSAALYDLPCFAALRTEFGKYEPAEPDLLNRPYFATGEPCTLLIDEIEAIWLLISERDDWSGFERKLSEISVMRDALL